MISFNIYFLNFDLKSNQVRFLNAIFTTIEYLPFTVNINKIKFELMGDFTVIQFFFSEDLANLC